MDIANQPRLGIVTYSSLRKLTQLLLTPVPCSPGALPLSLHSRNEPTKRVPYPAFSEGGQRWCLRLVGVEFQFGETPKQTEHSLPLCRRPARSKRGAPKTMHLSLSFRASRCT